MKNTVEVFGKWIVTIGGVSVTQSCSDRLVDEEEVVVKGPCVVVLNNFYIELTHEEQRTNFLKISNLRRRSRPSVQPQNSRVVLELIGVLDIFASVERVSEGRTALGSD